MKVKTSSPAEGELPLLAQLFERANWFILVSAFCKVALIGFEYDCCPVTTVQALYTLIPTSVNC